jgi:hypothetical protein
MLLFFIKLKNQSNQVMNFFHSYSYSLILHIWCVDTGFGLYRFPVYSGFKKHFQRKQNFWHFWHQVMRINVVKFGWILSWLIDWCLTPILAILWLYRFPVYSGFYLHRFPVYSGFYLHRFPVYSGFYLHRFLVYSGSLVFESIPNTYSLYLLKLITVGRSSSSTYKTRLKNL